MSHGCLFTSQPFLNAYRYQHSIAPEYLSELFVPLTGSGYSLRSASSNQLDVPAVKLSTCGARAFSCSGNSLPMEYLRDSSLSLGVIACDSSRHSCLRDPDLNIDRFWSPAKNASVWTVLGAPSALETPCDNAMLYKLALTFTYRVAAGVSVGGKVPRVPQRRLPAIRTVPGWEWQIRGSAARYHQSINQSINQSLQSVYSASRKASASTEAA